ncbi:HAD-IA family hydrolase [Microcoleus sp. FACHB-672]|uniref:HAD-IA family hydrolase n=1 Tax=Microcoleus sp. FACHB-672 TaxID=2692825 RepID=UPI0016862D4B|nr:HAD-IA family hydrolase [Microcoleus sp. FACHB-672]MBD2042750.1 HAD-IA family hydrolase [Microcoleus sp. FACHB-672]
MTVKVIVFDFDGTIADTLEALIVVINRLAVEFKYKQASRADIEQLKNLSSREVIKDSGVSIFKVPFLLRKVKLELAHEIPRIHPVPGIKEVLTQLRSQGNKLGIITSNSKPNVMSILQNNEAQDLFEFVYAETTLFGKHRVIKKFLIKEGFTPEEVVYVGDETRDIEAAKKSQIKIIAVTWGFNSKQVLAAQNPDFLIDRPEELIEVIESLKQRDFDSPKV